MSGKLIIIRHGESEWNATGRWTGITDVRLTAKGRGEGQKLGRKIADQRIDRVYVSEQIRTTETYQEITKYIQHAPQPERRWALNERDYGQYTGLNKWQVKERLGEEQFNCIRRDWSCEVPGGETLKDVYQRVIPFYKKEILPELLKHKNVLIVSHGNAIRALVKFIEEINNQDISKVEMIFGTVLIYTVSPTGHALSKEKRVIKTTLPPA